MDLKDIKITLKFKMNSSEIDDWKDGKYLLPFVGNYYKNQWHIFIFKDCFDKVGIRVYGYNGIKFGSFELNNGVLDNNLYRPILRFYNKLSESNFGMCASDTLCSDVEYEIKNDIIEINIDNIIGAVEHPWNKIRDFLNK